MALPARLGCTGCKPTNFRLSSLPLQYRTPRAEISNVLTKMVRRAPMPHHACGDNPRGCVEPQATEQLPRCSPVPPRERLRLRLKTAYDCGEMSPETHRIDDELACHRSGVDVEAKGKLVSSARFLRQAERAVVEQDRHRQYLRHHSSCPSEPQIATNGAWALQDNNEPGVHSRRHTWRQLGHSFYCY